MLEATFDLASPIPVTESKTKYNYVCHSLPPTRNSNSGARCDRKPSELFRAVKKLAENHTIDDSLLFELFNKAMPIPIQTMLASIPPITSDKAAEVADKILEINPNSISSVTSVHENPSLLFCVCDKSSFRNRTSSRRSKSFTKRSYRSLKVQWLTKDYTKRSCVIQIAWREAVLALLSFQGNEKKYVSPCSFQENSQ
ncbi:uncharacterized protein NPIL_88131 [Nephila pilipes]|uniref:Uncharacterized protein n=1 Tax=Nephila pilipes TaxID=299642 RepID=A0A8X6PVA1_NEPPI|nr:uncharacterized protein NPIL_88131 [Nephila pilipes]